MLASSDVDQGAAPADELAQLEHAAAGVDALAAPAPAPAGEGGEAASPAPAIDPARYTFAAQGMVETAAVLGKMFAGVEYDASTKAEVVEVLAPVLAKYGMELPPWLAKWREELNLARVLAMVGFSTWQQMRARAEAAAAAAAAQGEGANAPAPAA